MKKIKKWEIGGIFFLIFFGSFLHFAYELSGENPLMGFFSAVNESVWEHLKLGFWALIIFMLIEYWFVKKYIKNYFFAKAIGITTMQAFIILFFYSYTYILKTDSLILDIFSYLVGCVICQYLSYLIIKAKPLKIIFGYIGLTLIIIQALLLMLFTYKTPRLPIFQDGNTLQYGTEWNK